MSSLPWRCPVCREALAGNTILQCPQGHVYDVAHEGYVNLLRGDSTYRYMGDAKGMLVARRRFLSAGGYEPLRRRLRQLMAAMNTKVVLEAGCGEGYYIGGLSEQLINSICLGYDLSKHAAKLAAKVYPEAKFAVADTNKTIPLADESVTVILDIFAPRNGREFRRIVQADGHLIVVIPTERHLEGVRGVYTLMAIQPEKREAAVRSLQDWFRLQHSELLETPLKLDGPVLRDLIAMMPNGRLLSEAEEEHLRSRPPVVSIASFEILVFVPVPS